MYQRFAGKPLAQARLDTPVILLAGARQAGKSTLARAAALTEPGQIIRIITQTSALTGRYQTFDDAATRAAAAADPPGFIEGFRDRDWLVLDEVQRVPDVLVAIKRAVDDDRRPGRFILTGSPVPRTS